MQPRTVIIAAAVVFLTAGSIVIGYLRLIPEPAPAVTFTRIDGHSTALADLRGRPVLVHFWATSCAVCRREIPQLRTLYQDLKPRGLELFAVAMPYDPPNRVLKLAQEAPLPYPVALDIQGRAAQAFGYVSLTPTTFLISPAGRIVFERTGELDFDSLRQKIEALLPEQLQVTGRKAVTSNKS